MIVGIKFNYINVIKQTTIDKIKRLKPNLDFSKAIFVDLKTYIKVICPIHGVVEVTPFAILYQNVTCSKCSIEVRSNKRSLGVDEFIRKAREIHGDEYQYHLVEYKNVSTKVKIICSLHGVFEQTPRDHIYRDACGCPKCYNKNLPLTTLGFIEKAKFIHRDTYNYSKVEYKRNSNKVCIICNIHGEFWQTPNSHLMGANCPHCKNKITSTEKIVKQFKEVHGEKYDYSLVEYEKSNTPVKILCEKHGVFEQNISNHRKGAGCPNCKNSKLENIVYNFLTKNNISFIKEFKVNITQNRRFYYDFGIIKDNKIIGIIECHGAQHYTPLSFFGGQESFEKRQQRDLEKKEYCSTSLIPFIEIPYWYSEAEIYRDLKDFLTI